MPLDPVFLGILLLLTGLVFFLLVWGLPRVIRSRHPNPISGTPPQQLTDVSSHTHAVLLVQPGEQVDYVNTVARQWFDLHEGEQPNLEVLARRIRPSEDFLKICAVEGQARFSVNGRPMECVSYQVPGTNQSMLISMSRPGITSALLTESKEVSGSALKILIDFSQLVAASLGLPATIQTILENVERLVPADMLEIKLWEAEGQTIIPFRFGTGSGSERQLEKGPPQAPAGYSASLIEKRQFLFIYDTQKNSEIAYSSSSEQILIRSYVGLPLLAGNDLVGPLEVGLTNAEAFVQEDLEILQLVVGQAAAAIRNASMLEAEQRRSTELSSLANLAQARGSTGNTRDLFTRLVQSVTQRLCGFIADGRSRCCE